MAGRQGAGSGASRFLAPYYTVSALLVVGVYPLLRWRWLEAENFKYSRLQPGGLWEKARALPNRTAQLWGGHAAILAAAAGTACNAPHRAAATVMRTIPPPLPPSSLRPQERLVLSMLGASLAAKFWKRTSWDAFLSEAALYGKARGASC